MKRILLVKTSSLGDVIHNLPVVNDILQQHPKAQIDWVVEESFADIPKLHPAVKQVFPVALRRWRKSVVSKNTWSEIHHFKQAISKQTYDLIIDTQGLIKSAVLCLFANGVRHGLDKHSAREPLASYLYHKTYRVNRNQHAVTRNRELTAFAMDYSKPSDLPNYGIVKDLIKVDIDLPEKFVVGLHGTSKDSKLWPTEQWIESAQILAKDSCHLLLPWASDQERIRALEIADNQDNVFVLPKLSIAQLASIIKQSVAGIGVDTGLSHLCAALNIPTVAIYTDTDPKLTGVMASADGQVVNLGGKKQIPTVTSVMNALKQICAPL